MSTRLISSARTAVTPGSRSTVENRMYLRDLGNAIYLNGTNALIPITLNSGLPLTVTESFSISFWHKCTAFDGGYLWSQDKASSSFGPNFRLVARTDRKVGFYLRNDANVVVKDVASYKECIKLDVWQHYVFTTTQGAFPTAEMYVDAIDVNAGFPGYWNHGVAGASTFDKMTFGAQVRATTGAYHKGSYSQISIIKKSLSLAEVKNIYWKGIYPSDAKTLYLTFPEDSGGTSADQSGNGNTATLTNCAWVDDPVIGVRTTI